MNFLFSLKKMQAQEAAMQILVTSTMPSSQGSGFKSASIDYAALSPSEKITYDNFIVLIESKCQ